MIKQRVAFIKSGDTLSQLRKQGKSKNQADSIFNRHELSMGVLVEAEHVDDPNVAKEIAKDHLVEDARYYTKLKIFEAVKDKKGIQRKLLQWFKDNPNPSDEKQVHELAKKMNMNPHKLEEQIYRLVSEYAQLL